MAESTAQAPAVQAVPQRTLRLALAMRGGVSLAVWIGGAVTEIDLFRRACLTDSPATGIRADKYRELLTRTRKYNTVEIDILAGASAGGLNAVLYGLAQTCGSVLDTVAHDTWVRDGGMWELLRKPGFGRAPSLLRGDEQFFPVLRQALDAILASGGASTVAKRLSVELAATLLADVTKTDRANRARFSFMATQGTLISGYRGIPSTTDHDDAEILAALDRLALAARATSSFPGAFEPASIFSTTIRPSHPELEDPPALPPYFEPASHGDIKRGSSVEQRPESPMAGLGVNMSTAFPYARWFPFAHDDPVSDEPVSEPFYVVDGGIFDNIPIDRAIRAIAQAPAAHPSERYLLYLDPEPPTPPNAGTDAAHYDTALNWVRVIQRCLRLKQRSETSDDELNLILEHNNSVLAIRGRVEALADQVRRSPEILSELIDPQTYTQCRITTDTEWISQLLTNPWAELCQPPHAGGDYTALDPAQALTIKNQVSAAYNAPGVHELIPHDLIALADQVRVLLAWVRALEDLLQALAAGETDALATLLPDRTECAATLRGWKLTLYRWLTVLAEAKHHAIDEVLAQPLRTRTLNHSKYPLRQRLEESWETQRQLALSDALERLLCARGATEDESLFYQALSEARPFPPGAGRRIRDVAPEAFKSARDEIVGASKVISDEVCRLPQPLTPALRYWTESVYALFYTCPELASVAQLAMLFALTGVPDTASIINFDRITSDETPAVDTTVLADAARAVQLRTWIRKGTRGQPIHRLIDAPPDNLVTADAKLAGNVLSRFGGFLLTDWRRNDWQWGRLDAAAAITRILGDTRPPPTQRPHETEAQFRARLDEQEEQRRVDIKYLQDSIAADATLTGHGAANDAALTETVGGQTLGAVCPQYRFALASRVVPLLYRAVLPAGSSGWPTTSAAWLGQLLLLRPAAVPVPLVADPLRALLALATVLLSAALLGVSDSPRPLHIVYGLLFITIGSVITLRAVRLEMNWRTLKETIDTSNDRRVQWRKLLDSADRWWYRAASAVLGVAVTAIGGAHIYQVITRWHSGRAVQPDYPTVPFEAFAAAAVMILTAAHWLNKRSVDVVVPRTQVAIPRTVRSRRTALGAVAVALLGATILSAFATPSSHPQPWSAWLRPQATWMLGGSGPWFHAWTASAAIAGLAVAILTVLSLSGWAHPWGIASCAVGISTGAVLLQSVFDVWWRTTAGRPILDLLPTLTWMVLLGAVIAAIPVRLDNYGDPGAPRRPRGHREQARSA
ncbi:DUF3376 domain-containing protein [Mycobacterium vicinigordonae]|uniref:DUF3376 domain-containing protein n=1 Tax=Mycobacterium vicinigordonae TaxID=1719132 RepID=A0A7D6DV13_9MYCO|nr:DUF3376 domain-containing protein [Mycobacterium vicinigordonae]QLL05367.1 DUF3376 domain-containing protein [Mycobacterium vicinigordonae]